MSEDHDADTLVIEIAVGDEAMRQRLEGLLSNVAGIRLASPGEAADVAIIATPPSAAGQIFTAREIDVLMLLAEGASNKEIAARLGISPHTVKFHVGRLIDKLDATGRTDVVAHAARIGVIHL
ncbi:response regulator transcription factor [Terricaulis silvestris]|uniref:Transcriptional regulatory protein LiaR n=1 Tax=Terricaulis silvestris TaxID=2686094 RepID=A0A6I6MLW4_9CAUL|nr:helix-turn-helix transcriptional regulator [Terricaulis silvestris]QGZ93707.1 Transcriptional regulatory protein LiaR [Terricaulis silvestris]